MKHNSILFFDQNIVLEKNNVNLTVNPPVSRELILYPDREWESAFITFYTSLLDINGKLMLWYTCRDKNNVSNLAFAYSDDGIYWEKPELGIIKYGDSYKNNLVGIKDLDGSVFYDEKDIGRQFKYIVSTGRMDGIKIFTSPDGFHWNKEENVLLPFGSDTQNICLYDSRIGKYAVYLRGWYIKNKTTYSDRRRFVVRTELDNLYTPVLFPDSDSPVHVRDNKYPLVTTELPCVFERDEFEPEESDVYTMPVMVYPRDPTYYTAFPTRLYRLENYVSKGITYPGRTEVQFAGSADGEDWFRFNRSPYVTPGEPCSGCSNVVYMGQGMAIRGDRIIQIGTGYDSLHGDAETRKNLNEGNIYKYTSRLDGFVSADFDYRGGTLTTDFIECRGREMFVNIETGALGYARFEITVRNGVETDQSVYHSEPVQTNDTHYRVTWENVSDLSELYGKDVRIKITGNRFKLYSIRFE